jgi:hypothetical protein
MRALETQWWIIELPEEWDAEQDDETIIISDEDGVSEIAITTLEKADGLVDDNELKQYCHDVEQEYGAGGKIQVADLDGFYFTYKDQGDVVREWYLRYESMLLLITYSCEDENAGMDDSAVDQILGTLFIKPDRSD